MPPWVRGSLVLLATLLGGIAIGVSVDRAWRPPAGDGTMNPTAIMHTLDRELTLDSSQHASIAAVFAKHQSAIDSAWRAMRPGVQAAIDSAQMEIVRVLTPAQQAKYMELLRVSHPGMSTSGPASTRP